MYKGTCLNDMDFERVIKTVLTEFDRQRIRYAVIGFELSQVGRELRQRFGHAQ